MHIKLGLMKNFVKAMNQEEAAFTYLWEKFPDWVRQNWKKVFSLVHKYETLSRTNTSTLSFKAAKKPLGTVLNFKLWGACKQPYAELPEIRLIHVTKNTLPSLAFGFFFRRIVVQWVMNTENVPINTFLQTRRDIKGNGTVLCSPTTVGLWQGMPLPWNASDRQNEKKKYMIFFVLNNEFTIKRLCRCSIYFVNVTSKQNKPSKHIHSFPLNSLVFYLNHRSLQHFNLFHKISQCGIILKLEPSNLFYVPFLTS